MHIHAHLHTHTHTILYIRSNFFSIYMMSVTTSGILFTVNGIPFLPSITDVN